jgi:hypothetical protein
MLKDENKIFTTKVTTSLMAILAAPSCVIRTLRKNTKGNRRIDFLPSVFVLFVVVMF